MITIYTIVILGLIGTAVVGIIYQYLRDFTPFYTTTTAHQPAAHPPEDPIQHEEPSRDSMEEEEEEHDPSQLTIISIIASRHGVRSSRTFQWSQLPWKMMTPDDLSLPQEEVTTCYASHVEATAFLEEQQLCSQETTDGATMLPVPAATADADSSSNHTLLPLSSMNAVVCSICLEPLQLGDVALAPPCRHWFHRKCVQGWITSLTSGGHHHSLACPNCRCELLTAKQLQTVFVVAAPV